MKPVDNQQIHVDMILYVSLEIYVNFYNQLESFKAVSSKNAQIDQSNCDPCFFRSVD